MKKFFKYGIVALALIVPLVSFALEFRTGEQVSIGKNEKIKNDVYMVGGSVTSTGEVAGDLMTVGGNIIISGDVSEDLLAGGGNINILSNIGDDVRIGGGTVILQGKVGGDVVVGGGQINIGGPGIKGDVAAAGGSVRIDAPVAGNLSIAGGNIYINAPIEGNVQIEAEKLTLGSASVISGNLTYKAKSELVKEEGAIVKGKISFESIENKRVSPMVFLAIFSAFFLWKLFALLACALVIGLIFRRYSKEIISSATKRPLFELGRGLIVMITMPIISIILLTTLIGIPFGVMGLIGFVIVMLFAWIMTPIVVGSVVYRYFSKKELEVSWKTIFLGVFLYMLLGLIPFIGGLAQTLLMLMTLGSIVALKFKIIKEWR